MKQTFYFSHDYSARTDEKIKKLIFKFGMQGYGVFWAIIENLYNNANALQLDYDSIAFELRVEPDMIKSIINDFNLFVFNNGYFGSISIQNRLDIRNNKSTKARQSAYIRWNNANAKQPQYDGNAIKERKGKDNKEKDNKKGIPQKNKKNNSQKETFFTIPELKLNLNYNTKQIQDYIKQHISFFIKQGFHTNELPYIDEEIETLYKKELLEDIKTSDSWQEQIAMRLKITKEEVIAYIIEFAKQKFSTEYYRGLHEFKRYFENWINLKIKK